MRKHLIIGLFIATIASALMASSHISAAPSTQTVSRTYNNQVTAAFLAQELGIPEASILSITIGSRGAGCSVELSDPIITHQDSHTDLLGVTVITPRPQRALDRAQQARLDEIMETQGCFRSRT